jgi:hypothetical protein
LLAACTAVTRNSGACEQLMRNKLADTSQDTLTVAHRAAAIRGSRVVVEGTIEHVATASGVAAAAPAASAPAASAPGGASGARAASAASGVAAASAVGASHTAVSAQKPAKPQTVKLPAAAECTFHGEELNVFRWLAPARLATPAEGKAAG